MKSSKIDDAIWPESGAAGAGLGAGATKASKIEDAICPVVPELWGGCCCFGGTASKPSKIDEDIWPLGTVVGVGATFGTGAS